MVSDFLGNDQKLQKIITSEKNKDSTLLTILVTVYPKNIQTKSEANHAVICEKLKM